MKFIINILIIQIQTNYKKMYFDAKKQGEQVKEAKIALEFEKTEIQH